MTTANITTDNYSIISSGSASTFRDEPLKINFESSDGEKFSVHILFLYDNQKGRDVTTKVSDDNSYLNMYVYNVNETGSTKEPIHIANNNSNNKKIYLNLSFHKIADSFAVNFTVFEEK